MKPEIKDILDKHESLSETGTETLSDINFDFDKGSAVNNLKKSSSSGIGEDDDSVHLFKELAIEISDLKSKIKRAESNLKTKGGELKKIGSEMQKAREDLDNLNREFTNRMIQTLTIFISFFTFISVDMQIFKNVTNWTLAIALTLILLGAIVLFAVLINFFLIMAGDEKEKFIVFKDLWFKIGTGLVILGVILVCFFSDNLLVKQSDYDKFKNCLKDSSQYNFQQCIK